MKISEIEKIYSIGNKLLNSEICIIPTDTIYGIACLPVFKESIDKINEIKKRKNKSFLMISSGLDISKYIEISNFHKKYQNLYKGKTIISTPTKLSYKEFSNLINNNTISIRDTDNKIINELVKITKMPIVTTSVNISGNIFANSIENIDREVIKFFNPLNILDLGILNNKPSQIIDIQSDSLIKIIRF